MATDRFGLPVTTSSATALEAYGAAVDLILSAVHGAEARLNAALAADPGFALAHAAMARHLQLQGRMAEARAAAATARALVDGLTVRERQHVDAIATLVEGQPAAAWAKVEAHIAAFPRDGLVLSLALGVYGLLGFSGRRDHAPTQLTLLDSLAPHWGEDWWFLGYHGWSRVENERVAEGVPLIERSLAGNPRNAHAAHARAHAHFEAGEAESGAAFIEGWVGDYAPQGALHSHLYWHLALFELARGDSGKAVAIYADYIRPAVVHSAPMPRLVDAASFLWRCRLYDVPPARQAWPEVAAHLGASFPQAGIPFVDVHAALVGAATGDAAGLASRRGEIETRLAEGRLPAGPVVPAICRAAEDFAAGRHAEVVRGLKPLLDEVPRIGGSHAQRELVEDMVIVSALRSHDTAEAEALLARRLARRPSARDDRWLAEARAA